MIRFIFATSIFLLTKSIFCQEINVIKRQRIDNYYSQSIVDVKKFGAKVYILGKFESEPNSRTFSYSLTTVDLNGNVLEKKEIRYEKVDGYNNFEVLNDTTYLFRGFNWTEDPESTDCIICFNSNLKFKWRYNLETFQMGDIKTFILNDKIYCFSSIVFYIFDINGKLIKREKTKKMGLPLFYTRLKSNDFLEIGFDVDNSNKLEFNWFNNSLVQTKKKLFKINCECYLDNFYNVDGKLIGNFSVEETIPESLPKAIVFDYNGNVIDSISIHPDTINMYKTKLEYSDFNFQENRKILVGRIDESFGSSENVTILMVLDSKNKMKTKIFNKCTPWTRSRIIKLTDRRFYLITEAIRNDFQESNIELIEFEL